MMSDLQVRLGLRPGFGQQPDVGPEATLEQQAPEAVDTVADHADGARRTAPRMPMIGIQRLGRRPQIAWINPLVIQSNLDKVHESNQLRSSENPPNQYPQLRQERNTKKERRMQRQTMQLVSSWSHYLEFRCDDCGETTHLDAARNFSAAVACRSGKCRSSLDSSKRSPFETNSLGFAYRQVTVRTDDRHLDLV